MYQGAETMFGSTQPIKTIPFLQRGIN